MQAFQNKLDKMKAVCAIQDDEYWNLQLQPNDKPMETFDHHPQGYLSLETIEGFQIFLRFQYYPNGYHSHFNGYVQLPKHMHPEVKKFLLDPRNNFEDQLKNEITYHDSERDIYGWDHGHSEDACLLHSLDQQPDNRARIVSGPVQVLEEARHFIQSVLFWENIILQRMKQEELKGIEEELIARALAPHRVRNWVMAGIDMFD